MAGKTKLWNIRRNDDDEQAVTLVRVTLILNLLFIIILSEFQGSELSGLLVFALPKGQAPTQSIDSAVARVETDSVGDSAGH